MSTLKADAVTGQTTNGNLGLTGNGTGKVAIGDGTLIFPDADGSANQPIITNGSAALSFATLPIAGGGTGSTSTTYCSLTANVSGTLPIANGGTNSTSTTYCNLTSNVTGTLPVANGGSGAATHTANNVLIGNGTSAFGSVAPSTSGNVLTSNGSAWTSAAGPSGGLVFLQGVTASNDATVNLTTGIDSTYETYMICFNNVVPVTDSVIPEVRTSTDGGSSFDSTGGDYRYAGWRMSDGGYSSFSSTSADSIEFIDSGVDVGSASGEAWNAVLYLYHPSNASVYTYISFTSSHMAAGAGQATWAAGAGVRLSNADVDAIQLLFSSGNVESGEINLYGLVKS